MRQAGVPDATDFFIRLSYTRLVIAEAGRGGMRVYLDLVVLLNFLVDFLLLLGTNRLAGHPPGWKRCALAAALGGLYSGACMVRGLNFLGNTFWRLVFLGLMGVIAFGADRSAWKRCALFVMLSMALGGIALGLGGGSFWVLLLSACGVWLLCRLGFGGTAGGREYVPLEIRHQGSTLRLTALRDTGNTLRDPISGEAVLVVSAAAAGKLTGLTAEQLRRPLETMGAHALPGLRLIPYRAVGQSGGMLLAMRFRQVTVGDKRGPALVAFAPDRIGEGYQALMGGAL